uniref:P-type ATPase A domain-containing protein n=1 Tax=Arcella intermedia TaxID=1963864 RepID=A0A6B2KWY5_9EUKA
MNNRKGLSDADIPDIVKVETGRNNIEIPIMGLLEQGVRELFSPIPMYQYACCVVWYIHQYPFFASMILISVIITTILVIRRDRMAKFKLREMASHHIDIHVRRNEEWTMMDSKELLPGDVIKISEGGLVAPCDLVVVSGSLLVDESFMTGESIPIVKYQPVHENDTLYDPEKDKNLTVFGGTQILTASPTTNQGEVLAMCVRTGFQTSKGQLIKSILHKEPYSYGYERESFYYIMVSFALGTVMFFVSINVWRVFEIGVKQKEQILYGFESLLCLVPPFLPIIFNTTLLIGAANLEKIDIFTTSPSRIPIAGKVKTMCYDKTGTLTKTDLDVIGVVPVERIKDSNIANMVIPVDKLEEDHPLIEAMSTCHTLASIDDLQGKTSKRHYSGNTIDTKMFQTTNWTFHNASPEIHNQHVISPTGRKIEIYLRYDFDPALQRMSTLVKYHNESFRVFVKGSPEVIRECCLPESIPQDYKSIVRQFARDGCYCLALATLDIPQLQESEVVEMKRSQLERNLRFVGLLLMRNELKDDTAQGIREMRKGRINTVMITGDNIYTALYIAKKCQMINQRAGCFAAEMKEVDGAKRPVFRDVENRKRYLDPFDWIVTNPDGTTSRIDPSIVGLAVDAETFRWFNTQEEKRYRDLLVTNIQVFARMRPFDKQEVILNYINSGKIVGMIGDGANDCAALSVAHFGIALSEAEASMIAPFTAKSLSIRAAVELVKEGRACLVNAFSSFKFTIFYSMSEVTAMFISFTYGADLSQLEYIVLDFLFFFPVVFFMVQSKAASTLVGNPPTSKIFGPTTISSLLFPLLVLWSLNVVMIKLLQTRSWFVPNTVGTEADYQITETTCLFLLNTFVLSAASISWSFGSIYRKPNYSNIPLLVCWICEIIIIIIVFTIPFYFEKFRNFMEMVIIPNDFLGIIALLGVLGFFLILSFEYVVIIGPVASFCRKKTGRGRPKPKKMNF